MGLTINRIGEDTIIRYNKPCNRCAAITIDPVTGEKDPQGEPLATLKKYRLLDGSVNEVELGRRKCIGESPLFGVNFSAEKLGPVGLGDDVFIQV